MKVIAEHPPGGPSSPRQPATLLDLLVARNFQVTERFRAELRGELYNATNSLHLGRPNVQTNAGQAGRITNTQVPNRQVQLGLRLVF